MRQALTPDLLRTFMRRLGDEARTETTCYLVGGATALWYGWRESTRDIDLKFVPDDGELGLVIAQLKDELNINVEQASPDDFIPVPSGWQERSPLIARHGRVTFRHFDLYSQALAKVERSHERDLADLRAMAERDLITAAALRRYFAEIEPRLFERYAIDPVEFRANLDAALADGS